MDKRNAKNKSIMADSNIEFRLKLIDDMTSEMKKARKFTESSLKSMSKEQKEYRKAIEKTEDEIAKLNKEFVTASKSRQKEIRAEIALMNKYKTTLNKSARAEQISAGGKKGGGLTNAITTGNIAADFAVRGVDMIKDFAKNVVDITAKYEKYNATLKTTLGTQSNATQAMAMIKDIAKETPFQVDQLTESYIKLANRGFKPTRDEIISLGDLASATGKDFDQLAEALLDAQTGEFERLKEFGIKAAKDGDKVKFTFKGITTEVMNTESAINSYILSLGNLKGVSGSMNAVSQTLAGKFSNLEDSVANLTLAFGQKTSGLLFHLTSFAVEMVEAITPTERLSDAMKLQQAELYNLNLALQNTTEGSAEWNDNVATMISQYPEYFKGMDTEKIKAEDIAKAYDLINKSLGDKIASQIYEEKTSPLEKQIADLEEINQLDQIRLNYIKEYEKAAGKERDLIAERYQLIFNGEEITRYSSEQLNEDIKSNLEAINEFKSAIKNLEDVLGLEYTEAFTGALPSGFNPQGAFLNIQKEETAKPKGKTKNSRSMVKSGAGNERSIKESQNKRLTEGTDISRDRSVKQLNINIDKVVGVEQLETVNMKESTQQIGELIKRVLIDAIADASTHNQFN